jgi:hypothetical protein
MKNYSVLVKLVVCCALVCGTFQIASYGQGRKLSKQQIDAIATPTLQQCNGPSSTSQTVNGQVKNARLDPNSIIPTANAIEPNLTKIAKSMHGMWRGQVIGSPLDKQYERSKESNVDYFWVFDMVRHEALIIALRNGNTSTAGLSLGVSHAPTISYLICAHEGYMPNVEKASEIHQFTKVSHSIANAANVISKATGINFKTAQPTLSDLWQEIVAAGYFQTLPAVAFAGGFFSPIKLELVPMPIGPPQVAVSWNSQYYGGGATGIQFTPGVPMQGVEYTTFVATTGTNADYLVASPGNGKLAKVEAMVGGDYDLAFDASSWEVMCDGTCDGVCPECGAGVVAPPKQSSPAKLPSTNSRANHKKNNHRRNH